jgi:hypothetical protein
VAVTDTFLFVASMAPAIIVYVAFHVPELFVAATAAPPPNWLKSTVTPIIVALLLSPPAVLFHVAVTVSPILYAPPVPLAPLMEMFASVTFGTVDTNTPAAVLPVNVNVALLPASSFMVPPLSVI